LDVVSIRVASVVGTAVGIVVGIAEYVGICVVGDVVLSEAVVDRVHPATRSDATIQLISRTDKIYDDW
jgi:hypothetical protein